MQAGQSHREGQRTPARNVLQHHLRFGRRLGGIQRRASRAWGLCRAMPRRRARTQHHPRRGSQLLRSRTWAPSRVGGLSPRGEAPPLNTTRLTIGISLRRGGPQPYRRGSPVAWQGVARAIGLIPATGLRPRARWGRRWILPVRGLSYLLLLSPLLLADSFSVLVVCLW